MNQQPSAPHAAIPAGHQLNPNPQAATSPAEAASYLIPVHAAGRDDLLAALRLAVDATHNDLGCAACLGLACHVQEHQPRLAQIRAWRALAADIAGLPGIAEDEPMIRFDPDACRDWLRAGAARRAGIDEGFNSDDFTIAEGLEELLSLLNNDSTQHAWRTVAHLEDVQIWRTADSDGVDGGGILTADLSYMGERVRLASLHQGSDEFTDDPATSGIDAAVQALGHVADTLNREYANLRRATGCTPADGDDDADDSSTYTVVGVWVDDQPVPVGVIAGEHQVSGGDDGEYFPQGVWATSVVADHDLGAERDAIDQMRAENE